MGLGLPSLIASSTARPIAAKRPSHHPLRSRRVDERQQARRARIERMESVAESGEIADARITMALQDEPAASSRSPVSFELGVDLEVQLHALLARTTMDVVEHVDRRSHRAVDGHAAGRRHPGDRDRRCLGSMVDGRHECRLEERRLSARRQLAAQHEPDGVDESDVADELLDGIAAQRDLAGADVDDLRSATIAVLRRRGLPPTLRSSARAPHRRSTGVLMARPPVSRPPTRARRRRSSRTAPRRMAGPPRWCARPTSCSGSDGGRRSRR